MLGDYGDNERNCFSRTIPATKLFVSKVKMMAMVTSYSYIYKGRRVFVPMVVYDYL